MTQSNTTTVDGRVNFEYGQMTNSVQSKMAASVPVGVSRSFGVEIRSIDERKPRSHGMIELSVQKVMQHHVQTISPTASVVDAATELYDHDIGSLVVSDHSEDLPVGIVTKSDINMVVAEGKTPNEVSVEEIMSTPITSISTTETVQTAAELMRDQSIKKLPVIDEEEDLIGMLTASDSPITSRPLERKSTVTDRTTRPSNGRRCISG